MIESYRQIQDIMNEDGFVAPYYGEPWESAGLKILDYIKALRRQLKKSEGEYHESDGANDRSDHETAIC